LVQVGSQAHADRYTYLPQIGLYIAVVWGVVDILQPLRHRREILATVAPVIVAALGWRAWIQTGYWQDTERLWTRTLAVTGQNNFAHFAFGEYLLKVHRLDDAIAQFDFVLTRHPEDPDANFQMGYALMEKGEITAAISHFELTLKVRPEDPDAETNLGNLLLTAGRPGEAVEHYRIAVLHEPSRALAHYNLAIGLHRLGQLPEAIAQYKEALALDPTYPDAQEFLQQALLQNGQQDESSPDSRKH
jgi:tetratricopeptide (TPR) repeat protein